MGIQKNRLTETVSETVVLSTQNTCLKWVRKKYNFMLLDLCKRTNSSTLLMDYPINIDTISMELSILYFKGSQVKLSKF